MQRKVSLRQKLTAKEQEAIKKTMEVIATRDGFSCILLRATGGLDLSDKYGRFYDQPLGIWPLDSGYLSVGDLSCFKARNNHRLLLLALFLHVGSTEGL